MKKNTIKGVKEDFGHQNWCNYYKFPGCRTMGCHPCNCGYVKLSKVAKNKVGK